MPLIHLIYVSRAVSELSESELDTILAASARNNKPQSVTGLLLYAEGSFMQVLEGEESEVDAVFERIEKDPRHCDIFVLDKGPIDNRSFADWHMGFKRLGAKEIEAFPNYAPFFRGGFDPASIGAQPGLAMDMLLDFQTQQTSASAASGLYSL